jgi:tight adherence protein B
VRRAAEQERRRQISAQLKAIRRLEVMLVIPGGLCLLPAFVLLGIVPLVLQLIFG